MRSPKVLRLAALLFVLVAFAAYRGQPVAAQDNPACDEFWPVGTYYGEEVQCSGDWPGMMCDAICDYCRGWACSYVYQCQAASHISVVCQPG